MVNQKLIEQYLEEKAAIEHAANIRAMKTKKKDILKNEIGD